jgi:parvulin-like peptidyl-prolyl isomerase
MIRNGLIGLLLSGLAWGQSSTVAANPAQNTPQAAGTTVNAKAGTAGVVPVVLPDTPVITIHGLCQKPAAEKAAASDCETTITRRQFEELVDAFQPNMSPIARNQFAARYASALVMSQKAREMGLDHNPKYQQKLEIASMQLLMQLLNDELTEKANQVPDKDVEDYYQKNITAFEVADLQRIFIPRNQRVVLSKDKPVPSYKERPPQVAQAEMKKEADALRARAAAGEDFAKLQEEAVKFANIDTPAPSTVMEKTRRSSLPGSQSVVFDLKAGEVSEVIQNTSGFLIYKMGAKDTLPLDKVRAEILETLRSQRLKDSIQAMRQSAKSELNDNYFTIPDAGNVEPAAAPVAGPAPAPGVPPMTGPPPSSY